MTFARRGRISWRTEARRGMTLLYLLPAAYLLWPVLWAPLDLRSYNYFQAKRPVRPWTEVVVVAIDRDSRERFAPPVYPLSRHDEQHARVVDALHGAGARAIAFDLRLDEDSFDHPPEALAAALERAGNASLVMSMEEPRLAGSAGAARIREGRPPHPLLLAASRGAFVADVRIDSDGIVRRFHPQLGLVGQPSLPEHLAGRRVSKAVPIEFPSTAVPIPSVPYHRILDGDGEALAAVRGRIALVGLTNAGSEDYFAVPRLQDLGSGRRAFGLHGVQLLAAITETLIRGAPLRDAGWKLALAWNLLWSLLLVSILPRDRPALAAGVFAAVVVVALFATGWMHARGGIVFPAGLLFGCVLVTGVFTQIAFHLETSKSLHVEEAENERVQKELQTARATQERLLPQGLPELTHLDIWATNASSLEVSGDYFDVHDLGDSAPVVLAVADVSGKGLPAALLMSLVHAGLHTQLLDGSVDPAAALSRLNRLVHANVEDGRFVTMFLAEVEKSGRRLRYALAGHEQPFVISGGGGVRRLDFGNFLLGPFADVTYESRSVDLSPGDVVCVYSDGITEATNRDEEFFGEERLAELLRAHRAERAEAIGRAVLAGVSDHTRPARAADDVTLLVLKVC